jgi:hypothetical protein
MQDPVIWTREQPERIDNDRQGYAVLPNTVRWSELLRVSQLVACIMLITALSETIN